MNGKPSYLASLLHFQVPRHLYIRSNDQELLEVPRVKTILGERAFVHYAPFIWNQIPLEIRHSRNQQTFTQELKDRLL